MKAPNSHCQSAIPEPSSTAYGAKPVQGAPLLSPTKSSIRWARESALGNGTTKRPTSLSLFVEIQGDQFEGIIAELEKLGYKVKRAGE